MGSAKLLLTGVPGAGKTHLREVLVAEHGYFGLSLNDEDPPPATDAAKASTRPGGGREHSTSSTVPPRDQPDCCRAREIGL